MIYLSQLILNPASRMAQNESRRPYQLHRTVMRGFNCKREDANVLHRLDVDPDDGAMAVLVQSTIKPNWQPLMQIGQGEYLFSPPIWKSVDPPLHDGQILRFRLTANPTIKKVRRDENGERLNSNRVPLLREEKQAVWLQKRAADNGFHIQNAEISQAQKQTCRKKGITVYTVQFNGRLQITDAEKFKKALQKGIGPAKAFGCGLLSLAPA